VRPVSAAFNRTVRSSHTIAVRATVPTGWTTGVSPAGEGIAVVDGTVTLDSTAQVMGSLSLTTDGRGWKTAPGRHPVQPYGNELYVERGIVVGGQVQYVGLGYYKIYSVEQPDSPGGNLTVTGSDRMQGLIDAQIIIPVQFAAADTVADVFTQLVGAVYPEIQVEYDWDAAADELAASQVTQQDRYGFLNDLLTSRGKIMYFDYRGVLVVRSQPLDGPGAVWDVTSGADGTIISGDRTISRDNVFNAVAATSDGADTTTSPLAVAYDNNPQSPTYWYGKYGQVPTFYSSSTITSAAQAAAAASTMLAKSLQLPFSVQFDAVPNPALEPYDIVRVNYGSGSPDELHIVDTLDIPLDTDTAMTGTAHDPSKLIIGVTSYVD
jgi:hypothetical protein